MTINIEQGGETYRYTGLKLSGMEMAAIWESF